MKSTSLRAVLRAVSFVFIASAAVEAQDVPSSPSGGSVALAQIPTELLPALQRAHDVGPADPNRVLHLAVSLPYAKPAEMQAFADAVSDPKSPLYRKFATPEEIGARFGVSQLEIDQVADYLAANGIEVTLVGKNRLTVLADATVAQAEHAFHTKIRSFTLTPQDEVEPSQFVANSTPIRLPANLAARVIDVSGLETYTTPRHLNTTLLTAPLTRGLYDTQNMFAANVLGQGRTIGISNWDGFRSNNWLLYISHFSLPVPAGGAGSNIAIVPCQGGGAGAGTANAEGDLDIQMELGMAPLANIKIYDGTTTSNLVGVLTQEVNDNLCDAISESYGWNISASTATSAHNLHISMTAQGITYMAASGDSGTSLGSFDYPDYEPEVLQIGGTVANVNSTTGARVTEVGWSGSGGGWSTKTIAFNVRPSWQTGTGVLPLNSTTNHRLVPDIGFHAAGSGTGAYQFYFNNSLSSGFVGTSFASPVFCGLLAVTEQKIINGGGLPADGNGKHRFGRMQDLIYGQNGLASVWHDITSGNNGNRPDGSASNCTVGWDTVTGWGPMDCDAFATLLACGTDTDGDGTPDCSDGCPNDPNKIAPGQCGCGVPDTDSDGDGTANCHDGCPNDPAKIAPGICGCGVADTDSDGDGTPNCNDLCPNDPAKIAPGQCGCGIPDTDSDGDGTANCHDGCPNDPNKIAPGICGCGVADTDSDGDGTPNCNDLCANDPNKIAPGQCGCGVPDTDSDGDGVANCHDNCPNDPNKVQPGQCGCGIPDTDSDGDGVANCHDNCPNDPLKTSPGQCGCGVPDTDSDGDGTANCNDQCPSDPLKTAPGQCGCGVADTDSDGDGTANCNDGCPNDPLKTVPGQCGCGVPDTDSDGDGVPNCHDGCPNDPNKIAPGICGCGVADTDSDGDGTPNCNDLCPNDANKIAPGQCGCGIADTDSDGDGTPNCNDLCPNDANKIAPGQCGCGVADTDSDGDGVANCNDGCPNDPLKTAPGICGCGIADTDSDGDGTPNCNDLCPNDASKIAPGQCGCGVPDTDSDGDGVANCNDGCPNDALKTAPGQCGCGNPDTDTDGDGIADCHDNCVNLPNPGQEDCNQNGIGDVCDIASGFSLDVNADSIPDDCQGAGVEYCFGDGSGASCPCGNTDGFHSGCKNSTGDGARLYDQGGTSFANDDAVMTTIRLPHNKSGLLFMGKNQVSNPFGDGRLCISTSIKRFAIHSSGASGSIVQTNLVANSGGAIQAGSTWNFQAWYRDPQGPCGGTFNLSNAVQITFN